MHWNRFLAVALLFSPALYLTREAAAQAEPMVYKKRYAMGTVFEIVAYGDSAERTSAAIDSALDEVVRLDSVMSNFKADSDLSRMNREAHNQAIKIPADLYQIIETSLGYSRLSEGLFDVTVGPVVDLWKAALAGGATPTAAQLEKARSCVGYDKIELIPPDQIEFHSDCMSIDLGSIGKGYAVERAMTLLRSQGIERAYIDAGGSTIYGLGTPPDRDGWLVHLRDPSNRLDPQVKLVGNSVSTSEQTAASTLTGDAPGHIVVPGNGRPLRTCYTVSVTAKSATDSDALSTTLLLLGPQKGAALVSQLKGVVAIWIATNGQKTIAGSETTIVLRDQVSQGVAAGLDAVAASKEKKN